MLLIRESVSLFSFALAVYYKVVSFIFSVFVNFSTITWLFLCVQLFSLSIIKSLMDHVASNIKYFKYTIILYQAKFGYSNACVISCHILNCINYMSQNEHV